MIEQILTKLKDKKIAILGFGKEGKSTYTFLRKYFSDMPITILDQRKIEDEMKDKNVILITGEDYLDYLEDYDLIIKSPGISLKDKKIEKIKEKITSQIELFLEVNAKNTIGITGTKGKSTTTSLLYEVIKDQNPNVALIGNIGTPVFSIIENCNENTIFVMEISSHQLEFLHVSPHIGAILNLFEDHLDHAGSVEHYHNCKMKLFQNQKENDIQIYNEDNETLKNLVEKNHFKSIPFTVSFTNKNADIYKNENKIYYQDKIIYDINTKRNLVGEHNIFNIMVVLLISKLLHLKLEKTIKTITNFKPLSYRMECIGEVEEVEYYVDTLATIPEATIASIEALKKVNTIIMGGLDRGISYTKFIEYLKNTNIEHIICMPQTGHKIAQFLSKEKVYLVNTLEEAVELAKKITRKHTICLLSPAASSYDAFSNYQEKGDKFKEYVLK